MLHTLYTHHTCKVHTSYSSGSVWGRLLCLDTLISIHRGAGASVPADAALFVPGYSALKLPDMSTCRRIIGQ